MDIKILEMCLKILLALLSKDMMGYILLNYFPVLICCLTI